MAPPRPNRIAEARERRRQIVWQALEEATAAYEATAQAKREAEQAVSVVKAHYERCLAAFREEVEGVGAAERRGEGEGQ